MVRAALQSLPHDDRRLCILHYVMGYSHREISAALGIPVGTSKAGYTRRGIVSVA